VRLATFNLLHGRSVAHGGVDEAELRAAVAVLAADVLALQEVDRNQERSGSLDQTAVVADELGAAWWRFLPSMNGTPGKQTWTTATDDDGAHAPGPTYGVGLVSRLPVRSWSVRRFGPAPVPMPLMVPGRRGLTWVPDEPRVAVAAVIDAPFGPLTAIATHLSFVPGWNVAQLRDLVRWSRAFPGPRFLLGDLNLPGPVVGRVTGWARLARTPTYPSDRPRVQFDHVLSDRVDASSVSSAAGLQLPVSDHRAVTVDVDF
jgi:endonuclease/exonuclease/phosphatase family metal-dependent hydrolase